MFDIDHYDYRVRTCFLETCFRIHGVCAYESASYFYNEIDCHLQEFGLAINNSSRDEKTPSSYPDLIDIIDGYVADYGQCTKRELGKLQFSSPTRNVRGKNVSIGQISLKR